MITTLKPPRLLWKKEQDRWHIETAVGLNEFQIQRIIQWALPRQIDRYSGLPSGDRKDDLGHAIELLKQGKVIQKIVGFRGDGKGDIIAYGYN